MSRNLIKQIGRFAGFVAVPLFIVLAIGFIAVRRFEWYLILGLIVLVLCIAIFAATNPEAWQRRLGRQRVSSTISGIVVIIALIGIIALANVLLQRVNFQFDLTKNQTFTINDATVKVLNKLDAPVTAYIFYSANTQSQQQNASDLLKQFTSRSDKLSVQTVNVDADPLTTQKYNVKSDPSVVFVKGTNQQDVTTIDEQSLTRGLLRLETGVNRRVLITTGHNEYTPTSNQQGTSLSAAITALTDNNYNVQIYNTSSGTASPAVTSTTTAAPTTPTPITLDPGNDILLIAGPRGKFSDEEKTRITNFLKEGGKAFIAYDIAGNQDATQATNVNDLLAGWQVSFQRGVAIEQDQSKQLQTNPLYLIPNLSTTSDITSNLTGQNVLVPQSVAISTTSTISATYTSLLTTSDNSYLKTTVPPQTAEFEANDVRGPLTVGASVELQASMAAPVITGSTTVSGTAAPAPASGTTLNTRIVLLGSPLAISDAIIGQSIGNYNFFFNAMNYLNETGSDIVISNKTPTSTPFTATASQSSVAFWASFLGLPAVILLIGLAAWWRRR